jgi:8-oxo-dGTP pyrophosphatase MutT (NUDIX family)
VSETAPAPKPTRQETSCGGVVCRRNDAGQLEVVLIATHGRERWALPKGLTHQSETLEETAVREVREETGLTARILEPFEPIEYWFWWGQPGRKTRHHKKVHYFLMAYLSGDVADHDHEVDDAQWFPIEQAIQLASYKSERQLLEQTQHRAETLL